MANLRIVYDNAADRATITANQTAGTLAATNLQTELKSEIWRSTAKTGAMLTLTWASPEIIGAVVLPFINLTSTGTVRVKGYTLAADVSPAFDTTDVIAAPSGFGAYEWGTLPLGVNSFSYGGGTYAVVWFTPTAVQKLEVYFTDSANSSNYIEASRIVCGSYWSPTINCEYGAEVLAGDMSKHERSDAGDLRTDRGPRFKNLKFNLSLLPTTDRNSVWRIIYGNGMSKPVYVALMPEDTDLAGSQIFQIYGKLAKQTALTYSFFNQFNSSIELEEF